MGSLGTSRTTSRVTSRVSTRVVPLPLPMNMFPPPNPLLFEEEELEEDFFPMAPAAPNNAPPALLLFADGFEEEDLDEDLLFDEELDPPFELPSTTNKTATITTAASVTNTIMAVRRKARGMLYSSYP